MKIGLLSPSIYMSPKYYKDRIFAPRDLSISLANGLVDRGHEVYFFTAPDIETKAKLIIGDRNLLQNNFIEEKLQNKPSGQTKWASLYNLKRNYELDLTERCYKMAIQGKLDIIHSYHDTLAHFLNDLTGFPTVYTLHDPLSTNKTGLSYWLLNKFSHHNYVSISNAFRKHDQLHLNFVSTVYHGVKALVKKDFSDNECYLAFIGRMEKEKGIELAIDVANLVGIKLIIATSPVEQSMSLPYYLDIIAPNVDPKTVSLVGFLGEEQKYNFLANAFCLLFPILWEEPFGMVMIEAMACGTPVIAFARGSVPEIVKDGQTGFIINPSDSDIRGDWVIKKTGVDGLIEAVKKVTSMTREEYQNMRHACRTHVEKNFTVEKMVEGYEKTYRKLLAR